MPQEKVCINCDLRFFTDNKNTIYFTLTKGYFNLQSSNRNDLSPDQKSTKHNPDILIKSVIHEQIHR